MEVLVVGPAVTGPLEVGPAETGPALSANCGSDGRRARVRARGKRVEGRPLRLGSKKPGCAVPRAIDVQNPLPAFICRQLV